MALAVASNATGCTSPSALNYHPLASRDDGGCIEPVFGCTLTNGSLYDGVASDTPRFESLWVGSPRLGLVSWPSSRAVLNHQPTANVLRGCILAIEGCTDSAALNYDPDATVNSNDWCVLPRRGCMLPGADEAATALAQNASVVSDGAARPASAAARRVHWHDGLGLSVNFDPDATVHDASLCRLERRGCQSPTALNYDSHATLPGTCYEPVFGCLDPRALNFDCSLNVTTHEMDALAAAAIAQAAGAANASNASTSAASASAASPLSPSLCLPHAAAPTASSNSSTSHARPPARATVHHYQLCTYPPPPPYALYAVLSALGLATLGLLTFYLRRRSAKVDAATAVALASTLTAKATTRGFKPAATATVRALAATATALPDRQAANTYREVLKLRRKLDAATEAAGAAARLATEVDTLRSSAQTLRTEMTAQHTAHSETAAELSALHKRFERLSSTHEASRDAHEAAAGEAAAALAATAAALERKTREQQVSGAALAAALAAVEADLAASEIKAAEQQSAAQAAAAAAASAMAEADARDGAVRGALAEADMQLGTSVDAYERCLRTCELAEAAAARSAMEARVLRIGVGEVEDEVVTTARGVTLELEERSQRELAGLTVTHEAQQATSQQAVTSLSAANEQLTIQVHDLEAEGKEARESYEMQIELLSERIATLDELLNGVKAEQLAAATAAAASVASLEREKAAAAEKLEVELQRLEAEKEKETANLKNKMQRMQSMQSAALAAGSARGRQMLYAETLKQRRTQQALHAMSVNAPATPPPPVKWPTAAAKAAAAGKAVAAGTAETAAVALAYDEEAALSPEAAATGEASAA